MDNKYEYKNIRELFQLDQPEGLSKEYIERIRQQFNGLPKALENYYKLCGGCKDMNSAQNFLLAPDKKYGYTSIDKFIYPGYCPFYIENQCVNIWGIKQSDINQENPEVYITQDNGKTWEPTNDSVSQFLISQAYMNALFSMEYSTEEFYRITSNQIKQLSKQFSFVEDAKSNINNGIQFLQPYEDTIIIIINSNDEIGDLCYSSRSEKHFNEINKIIYTILGIELSSDEE
ncbi:hypothetical protein BCR32DRAFT_290835 [Anaeromyces robustus]|uniref:Knr4/Smi1-like domain-containing protein n=1 Tax=Anaeromyces robustus TaxID=1754192 RepID=A0A1Y1XHF1_9FUNG|nr:hypothetical protein BCR32DRAFT_290835 [Anaeromyces robustus]|eukprot:ORX85167.1 hypothetical protein BCR32DRAFT_290835 [Anaeromyces robustus]